MVFEAAFDSEQIVGSAIDELNFSLLVQKDLNEQSLAAHSRSWKGLRGGIGSSQSCWSVGGTTKPLVEKVTPTIAFRVTFDGEQRLGARFQLAVLRPFNPKKMGCALGLVAGSGSAG